MKACRHFAQQFSMQAKTKDIRGRLVSIPVFLFAKNTLVVSIVQR